MAGINFFSPHIEHAKRMKKNINRLISAGLIIVLFAGGFSGYKFYQIYNIKAKIQTLEAHLAAPEMQAKKKEMETIKQWMNVGMKYYPEIKAKEDRIQAVDLINVKFMDTITSTLPARTIFSTFTINPVSGLNLTGKAPSRRAVAELEYNLKKTGVFRQVHVLNITKDNQTTFSYTLSAIFH